MTRPAQTSGTHSRCRGLSRDHILCYCQVAKHSTTALVPVYLYLTLLVSIYFVLYRPSSLVKCLRYHRQLTIVASRQSTHHVPTTWRIKIQQVVVANTFISLSWCTRFYQVALDTSAGIRDRPAKGSSRPAVCNFSPSLFATFCLSTLLKGSGKNCMCASFDTLLSLVGLKPIKCFQLLR